MGEGQEVKGRGGEEKEGEKVAGGKGG